MGEAALTLPDGSERRLEGQTSVGRDEVCEVRLGGKTVSRRHALLVRRDDRWWISVRRVGNGYYVVDFGADVTGKVILASSARAAPMTGRVAES